MPALCAVETPQGREMVSQLAEAQRPCADAAIMHGIGRVNEHQEPDLAAFLHEPARDLVGENAGSAPAADEIGTVGLGVADRAHQRRREFGECRRRHEPIFLAAIEADAEERLVLAHGLGERLYGCAAEKPEERRARALGLYRRETRLRL